MDSDLTLDRIATTRYRPSHEAEEALEYFRRTIIPGEKFRVARLAIARSLAEVSEPTALPKGTDMGGAIEGTHLFGEDKSTWAALVVQSAGRMLSADEFRKTLEAHWHRGALLLRRDHEQADESQVDFAVGLAERAFAAGTSRPCRHEAGTAPLAESIGALSVRVGEIGIEQRSNAPVDVVLNAPGVAPHLAVMGKTRSGKTRTGLSMAERIARHGDLPLLVVDPKGEFVKDGQLLAKSEWGGATLEAKFPGVRAVDVQLSPVPLDFLSLEHSATDTDIAEAAIGFRDSFSHCVRTRGDIAMDQLRQIVSDLLATNRAIDEAVPTPVRSTVSLEDIRDEVIRVNQAASRRTDSVEAKLRELTSLRLFAPEMSPQEFFTKRWVVGLGRAQAETRRLVIFLLLDALARFMTRQPDADTDSAGNRGVRHLLVVDEAKEILAYRHAALSDLVRKGAAKGEIVMLLSQSPEDFDQEEDDFLSQVGTVVIFASSAQSVRKLSGSLGRRFRPEDFSDRELPSGTALVKVPGKDPMKVTAWKK